MVQCSFMKSNGEQCKLHTGAGSKFCHRHIGASSPVASAEKSKDGWDFSIDEASMSAMPEISMGSLPATPKSSFRGPVVDVDALLTQLKTLELENKALRSKLIISKRSTIESKAKLLFYHDNKKRTDIVGVVEERLRKGEAVMLKKDGKMYVPWRFVKACTDHVWAETDAETKEEYMQKAVTEIAKK